MKSFCQVDGRPSPEASILDQPAPVVVPHSIVGGPFLAMQLNGGCWPIPVRQVQAGVGEIAALWEPDFLRLGSTQNRPSMEGTAQPEGSTPQSGAGQTFSARVLACYYALARSRFGGWSAVSMNYPLGAVGMSWMILTTFTISPRLLLMVALLPQAAQSASPSRS